MTGQPNRKEEMMNARRIEGAVALVTGANRGIGRALTEALLTRGVRKVYATARNPEALRDLRDERLVSLRLGVTAAAMEDCGAGRATVAMPYKVVHGASDVAVGQRGYS
jgi:NAD(P)-dependent dehydrogenase (short-subunit alcohol dehydrogenase family)